MVLYGKNVSTISNQSKTKCFLIIILGVKGMVNILNLAEVQEQKQIDEITKCIVDSLINEVEKSLSKTKIER